MSDDLVKRLRETTYMYQVDCELKMKCVDRIEALEATLRKLEQWFDTDQEILDVMGNNERADHMRKLKLIRDTLTGGQKDGC